VASPEPSLSSATPEPSSPDDLDGEAPGDHRPGGNGSARTTNRTARPTARPLRLDAAQRTAASAALSDAAVEDDLLLDELTAPVVPIEPGTSAVAAPVVVPDDEDDLTVYGTEPDDDELVDVGGASSERGKLKARKVRRVVRYVSPWSVLKVSLLFYACLWVILTIASVLLWRAAVTTGAIENVEKFLARVFGESEFTIDGREIFRASTIAGLILVFAGTGFTVMMSLLFNVICDITGGIRFTVLELESTKRVRKIRSGE
jgi:hypothetical protein